MSFLQHILRRPVTVVVLILSLALGGLFGMRRMPKDVFPPLNVPTIYVAQPFGGMDAAQMEGFLTYYYEYHFLYITGIEHVESRNIQGAAIMKLQFQPGTDMSQAMSETVGYVNRARAMMPPGTVPPFVMRFDAGSVPVGQLELLRQQGEAADSALQLALRRKEFAVGVVLEAVQSQQDALQAKFEYLKALTEANKAQYRLRFAIGD